MMGKAEKPRTQYRQNTLVLLGLISFVLMAATSMTRKSPTDDESVYLTAGYYYITTRDFGLNPDHPPVIKMVAALPLMPLGLDPPTWDRKESHWQVGERFVFRNRRSAELIIFMGRLPIVLMGVLLGGFVYVWSRQIAGVPSGILALVLYVFDPNILAQSQLVTMDLGLALFFLLAVYFLVRYLTRPSKLNLWIAGAAFALAMLSKFPAIMLIPVYAALSLAYRAGRGLAHVWACWWRLAAATVISTVGIAFVAYGFEFRPAGPPPSWLTDSIEGIGSPSGIPTRLSAGVVQVLSNIPVPAPSFSRGFKWQLERNLGNPGLCYLRGEVHWGRCLEYYPQVFALKTPLGTLVLLMAAFGILFYRKLTKGAQASIHLDEWAALLAAGMFFGLSMLTKIQLGVRYILPVYPLIFVFISSQLAWLLWQGGQRARPLATLGIVAAVAWIAVSSVRVYPHYSAYFNELAGGPQNGWRHLPDSNLDFRQDLPGLKAYLKNLRVNEVYLDYNGAAPPEYYGIRWKRLPTDREVAQTGLPRGIVAVGVSSLFLQSESKRWLRAHHPVTSIGHSIWIYDFRKATRQ